MQQSVTSSSPSGGGTTEQARDKAQQATEQAREAAQQATEQARGRVQQELDTRSTKVGEQIGSTADDLRTVGKELRNQGQETPAKVAEQVAERAERVAGYLRDADGNKILSDVEGFARRQPWAVVAGGLLAGFAASRFLKASSSERYRSGAGSTSRPGSSVPAASYGSTTGTTGLSSTSSATGSGLEAFDREQ